MRPTHFARLASSFAVFAVLASLLAACSTKDDLPTASRKPKDPEDDPSFYVDAGANGGAAGATTCATGEKACAGKCVGIADPASGCGGPTCVPCNSTNAVSTCVDGQCAVKSCSPGFFDCDGDPSNGCESTLKDESNCGACGVACTVANGKGTCATGTCKLESCNAHFADCDGDPKNGCEQSLETSAACGACGKACGAGMSCATGTCAPATCPAGQANCDGNGCKPLTSLGSCGGCDTPCALPHATASCGAGTCALVACDPGFGDCDHDPGNGCEADLGKTGNCGACGIACSFAHGSGTCASGKCTVGQCDPGYGSCDGEGTNGCEASLLTPAACGICGNACVTPHATPGCTANGCTIATCDQGFADCDGKVDDGCEADLSSPANCGKCGNACPSGQSCVKGSCAKSCGTLTPCGGACVDTTTDAKNCGGCGVACSSTQACQAGKCVPICPAGDVVCNGVCTDVQTDPANCGACAKPCSTGGKCQSGQCVTTCTMPTVDCNGACVDLTTDSAHCGSCTNACALAESCMGGKCVTTCASIPGTTLCNGQCVDTSTDPANCGGCGVPCSSPDGSAVCQGGACVVGQCPAGFLDCNFNPLDGCETDATTNTDCGMCGFACTGTATCQNMTCQCPGGLTQCSGVCVDTSKDASNCGGCGLVCSPPDNSAVCNGGACVVTSCPAGFWDCNANGFDGCESTLGTVQNCSACGDACPSYPNSIPVCVTLSAQMCSYQCNAGFLDCDLAPTDGCEVDGTSDDQNCGACGTACGSTSGTHCAAGECLSNVQAVGVGLEHACAKRNGGEVLCWGDNTFGQLGNGVTGGSSTTPQSIASGLSATALAVGANHTCILSPQSPGVVCWGDNSHGQGTTQMILPVTSIAGLRAGGDVTCVFGANGAGIPTIACWGAGDQHQNGGNADSSTPITITAGATIADVQLGEKFGCYRTTAGRVYCWGDNGFGQLGNGTSPSTATPQLLPTTSIPNLFVGRRHACVYDGKNGSNVCWGDDSAGQFGDGTTSATPLPPTPVPSGGSGFVGMTAHAALDTGWIPGNVAWALASGDNSGGQLGNGTTSPATTTMQIGDVSPNLTVIGGSLGPDFACLLYSDGRVRCAGDDTSGKLGYGQPGQSSTSFGVVGGL